MNEPGETPPNIRFSSNVFLVLIRAKSKSESPIAQKALLKKGMFGSVPLGITKFAKMMSHC